jgi:hypothetical protein
MLSAQPADEDPAPDEDPHVMIYPPFDFSGLGQITQQAPFHDVEQNMELEPQDDGDPPMPQWST